MISKFLGKNPNKSRSWQNKASTRALYEYVFSPKYSFKNSYKGYFEPPFTFSFFAKTNYKYVINKARTKLDSELQSATLPVMLGVDDDNEVHVSDLTKLRHILISGAQGGGKTIGVLSLLTSLIYFAEPASYHLHTFDIKGDLLFLSNFGNYYPSLEKMKEGITLIKKLHNSHSELRKKHKLASIDEVNESAEKRLRYNVILVDEFFFLSDKLPELWAFAEHLMAVGRADGFYFILTTQRADHNSVSTNARHNAMTRLSFWQRDARESNIAGVKGAENLKDAGDYIMTTAMIKSQKLSIPRTNHKEMRMFLSQLESWAGKKAKNTPNIAW